MKGGWLGGRKHVYGLFRVVTSQEVSTIDPDKPRMPDRHLAGIGIIFRGIPPIQYPS